MSKFIYGLALSLVLGSTMAFATGRGGGDILSPEQEQGQAQLQGQHQGQHQGQGQAQKQQANADATGVGVGIGKGGDATAVGVNKNANLNNNEANAGAIAGSKSDSNSSAYGGDNTTLVGVGVKTGPTVSGSRSSASGGDGGNAKSYASGGAGGDSSSQSQVGDTSAYSEGAVSSSGAHTGDVRVSIADNSRSKYTYEESSARAAQVYAQVCTNGGSAQAKAGGFAIANQDVVCEHLKVASVMREAYMWEMTHGSAYCQDPMEGQEVGVATYSDTCMSEKAIEYYKAYHEHLTEAIQAMEAYEEVGLADKIAGALVRPMALIGALVWLL